MITDKVIIQGVVHKQIFFVDVDGLERHQAEDVPFSTFVDVPGAAAGMNVRVDSQIETVIFHLESSTDLRQKVVIAFFVKVTQTVQLRVAQGNGPLFRLPEVIGENTEQTLVESIVNLTQPAIKVREIIASITNVAARAILNKVIVQGTIHKQIFFIGTDDIEHHQAEDVPFSLFLDIPGTTAEMDVQVTTVIETVLFNLLNENQVEQKVVIQTFVKVTQDIQFRMLIGQGTLVRAEQVVGENNRQILIRVVPQIIPTPTVSPTISPTVSPISITKIPVFIPGVQEVFTQQVLVENSVTLPVPAIKIRAVTGRITNLTTRIAPDALLIQGNVEKSIDFVDTSNRVRNLQEVVPFSILLSVPGITPDQPITVQVELENISFNLTNNGMTLNQVIVIRATATVATGGQVVNVVTSIVAPGVMATTLAVRALVLQNGVPTLEDFSVVTDVTGPAVLSVSRQVIPLIVLNSGNPQPVPVEVVTDVTLRP